MSNQKNVFGDDLKECSVKPLTGYFRDGCCNTNSSDLGLHVVCVEVTKQFLEYSKSSGNDLSTPNPDVGSPGLKPGDRWCLCADRWKEALDAGATPPVILSATNEKVLEIIELEDLKRYAIDVI